MPYCPKCDMEFVEGITVCSDCGGPLVESEEVAKAMKREEKERARKLREAQIIAEYKRSLAASTGAGFPWESEDEWESGSDTDTESRMEDGVSGQASSPRPLVEAAGILENMAREFTPTPVYVKKEQRYEDLKSSTMAFLIVGSVLLVFSLLCWTGILRLPMNQSSKIIVQTAMTLMGAASLAVSFMTSKSAKNMYGEIAAENQATTDLIQWFLDTYTGESLDQVILSQYSDLSVEELCLKRFELILDNLITHHDLPNQAYVETLCEEIYTKLYES